jgi:hypothetical protein
VTRDNNDDDGDGVTRDNNDNDGDGVTTSMATAQQATTLMTSMATARRATMSTTLMVTSRCSNTLYTSNTNMGFGTQSMGVCSLNHDLTTSYRLSNTPYPIFPKILPHLHNVLMV